MACCLPLNPSVYSAALRDGCRVSRPVWPMLVVLDSAVCLQSKKQILLFCWPTSTKPVGVNMKLSNVQMVATTSHSDVSVCWLFEESWTGVETSTLSPWSLL